MTLTEMNMYLDVKTFFMFFWVAGTFAQDQTCQQLQRRHDIDENYQNPDKYLIESHSNT